MGTEEPDSSATLQRFVADAVGATLGCSTDVDACSALAARVDTLLDQAGDYFRRQGTAVACRAGCSFCCHLRVMVRPHEAIALFRHLGSRLPAQIAAAVRARLLGNAARIRELGPAGHALTRLACAFLVDGHCCAYEVRPSACSGYHSLDRARCEAAHADPGEQAAIPVSAALGHIAGELNAGLERALAAAGLDGAEAELHTAVAALVRDPALIARWRAGRSLLKGAGAAR
ncbi:MAG TPA: hypothetical protein VMB48_00040 [Steroidobacteraceae bacterium]|nr:hypothetical protein [Steroidobacteraceae bacterium]